MERKPDQQAGTSSRRAFLGKGLALGAGAVGASLLANGMPAFAERVSTDLTDGDVAILRFLAAAEIIESDLWQQYNELGGIPDKEVPGGTGNKPYTNALSQLDADMSQYIHDNTEDEISHFKFINAFLMAHGEAPVSLDKFRTLKGSQAPGADKNAKRLTNLMKLKVDTSWWIKYRSRTGNPDLGDSFAQAIPTLFAGHFPAIPRDASDLVGSTDTMATNHLQAIANTAAFHFGFIEQGGTSLYPSLAQRVSSPEVLRILLAIGPTEAMHFQTWHDKAGNAKQVKDGSLEFPDLNAGNNEDTQTNLIMPEPTLFQKGFPVVSIVRPTKTEGAAMGAVNALIVDNLFEGQGPTFIPFLRSLAQAADAARREY